MNDFKKFLETIRYIQLDNTGKVVKALGSGKAKQFQKRTLETNLAE